MQHTHGERESICSGMRKLLDIHDSHSVYIKRMVRAKVRKNVHEVSDLIEVVAISFFSCARTLTYSWNIQIFCDGVIQRLNQRVSNAATLILFTIENGKDDTTEWQREREREIEEDTRKKTLYIISISSFVAVTLSHLSYSDVHGMANTKCFWSCMVGFSRRESAHSLSHQKNKNRKQLEKWSGNSGLSKWIVVKA